MYMSNVNAIGAFRPRGGYLLDSYPGAAAAYSLRKLSSDTTNVVRVQRNSDFQQRDFTAQEILDGDLETWVGTSANGLVVVWYDQSGNNNNATATTQFSPIIVDNGVQVTEDGIPMIDFNLTGYKRLIIASPVPYTNGAYTFFGNGTQQSDVNNKEIFLSGNTGSFEFGFQVVGAEKRIYADRRSEAFLGNLVIPENSRRYYAVACLVNNTQAKFSANTSQGLGLEVSASFTQPVTYVGGGPTTSGDFQGKMGDWILYDTDQWINQPQIQANINSYYSIY